MSLGRFGSVVALSVLVLLAACAPSQAAVETAIARTQSAVATATLPADQISIDFFTIYLTDAIKEFDAEGAVLPKYRGYVRFLVRGNTVSFYFSGVADPPEEVISLVLDVFYLANESAQRIRADTWVMARVELTEYGPCGSSATYFIDGADEIESVFGGDGEFTELLDVSVDPGCLETPAP